MARELRVPRQDRSTRTRERIAEAARTCFARNGYDSTQAKDIAHEAGVSVGTFYEYFRDKGNAFALVLDGFYSELDSLDLEGCLTSDDGPDRFAGLLSALRSWADAFGHLFVDFSTLATRDVAFEESLARLGARIERRIRDALESTVLRDRTDRAANAAQLVYTLAEAVLVRTASELDETASRSLLGEAAICLDAYIRASLQR